MKLTLLIGLAFFVHAVDAAASTITTPAALLTEAVENAISRQWDRDGIVNEVHSTELFSKEKTEELSKIAQMNLLDRFQILGDKQVLDPKTKNRVLAITAFQVSEDRRSEVGRYVVWMNAKLPPPAWESKIWTAWETESKAQSLFGLSTVKLENKGVWRQPDTKYLDGRHAEVGVSPGRPDPVRDAKQLEAIPSLGEEVLYRVKGQPSYANPEEVDLHLVIENNSKKVMVVVLTGLHRIRLYGPDGQLVRPYPYRPGGRGSNFYTIECYPPGGRHEREFRLSALFPFPTVGEYRCVITDRVYVWDSATVPDTNDLMDNDYYGVPLEVTAEEINFRVETPTPANRPKMKVDPSNGIVEPGLDYDAISMGTEKYPLLGEGHFKAARSDAAKSKTSMDNLGDSGMQPNAPKKDFEAKPATQADEEKAAAMPWGMIAVLSVVVLGLLALLLKRRS